MPIYVVTYLLYQLFTETENLSTPFDANIPLSVKYACGVLLHRNLNFVPYSALSSLTKGELYAN